jgi:hypothetical protein
MEMYWGSRRRSGGGNWRKLHNEEVNKLYASPNIMVIKSKRIRWAEHVARM